MRQELVRQGLVRAFGEKDMRAIMVAALLLGGCGTMTGGQQLTEREWRAADLNGAPIAGSAAPTLRLVAGRVSGSTGCNEFSGAYRMLSDQRIAIEGVERTARACEPAIMQQEKAYLSILENARGYSLYRDGSLSLIAADGRAIRYRAGSSPAR
jgi:heat shock protein HslJ